MNTSNLNTDKLLLTAKEASEVLSLSIPTVRRRIADSTLPSIHIGGNVRIPVEALRTFINNLSHK